MKNVAQSARKWKNDASRKKAGEAHKNSVVWITSMNTPEYKRIQSETKLGNKNGMFGKRHSPEAIQKMRDAAKKRSENTEWIQNQKSYIPTPEQKEKHKRAMNTEEIKSIRRKQRLKQIKESGGFPSFSYTACDFFSKVNQKLNWNGQFATSGGEKEIGGYSVDYFVPEKNLIIEWDEEAHFRDNPTREKHAKRQETLLAMGVKFYRIREKTLGVTKVDLYPDNYLDKLSEIVNG